MSTYFAPMQTPLVLGSFFLKDISMRRKFKSQRLHIQYRDLLERVYLANMPDRRVQGNKFQRFSYDQWIAQLVALISGKQCP